MALERPHRIVNVLHRNHKESTCLPTDACSASANKPPRLFVPDFASR